MDMSDISGRAKPARFRRVLDREVCGRLAGGESLRRICEDPDMPDVTTVMGWLFDERRVAFASEYRRAREAQAELWAEEVVQIADGACDKDSLALAKLRTDIRRWATAQGRLPSLRAHLPPNSHQVR